MEDEIVEILAKAYEEKGYTLDKEDAKLKLREFKITKNESDKLDHDIEDIITHVLEKKEYSISIEDAKLIIIDIVKEAPHIKLFDFEKKSLWIRALLADPKNIFMIYQFLLINPPQWYGEKYAAFRC